jgi:uncharacterized protein
MNVFVDTSALLALSDSDDLSHTMAAKVWRRLINEKHELFTTNYVLVETTTLLQTRTGVEAVRGFQAAIAPLLRTVWIGEDVHKTSLQTLLIANLRRLSLVDCSSMTVARQLGIEHFFAFDRHFAQRGFTCLVAQ